MIKHSIYLLIAIGIMQGMAGGNGNAAETVNQVNSPLMEEVVVSATRHEEKLTDVPASVTILTEQDIRGTSARNIPELLRMQPGIQVNDISGNRRSYSVDLRGFGESAPANTLVLIDGRRVTLPDLSGTDWAMVPLERIERIEIIKGGGGSVLYGDNAAGGVVNIITKQGKAFHAGGEVSAGSYNTYKTTGFVEGKERNLSYQFTGAYGTSDGYRVNSRTEGGDAGMDLLFIPAEKVKLSLSGGYHQDNTGLPGALKDSDFAAGIGRKESIYPDDFAETDDYYLKGSPEITFGDANIFRLDLSLRQRDFSSFASGTWGNFTGSTQLTAVDISPHVVINDTIKGMVNSLTIGADIHRVREEITNDSNFFGSQSSEDFVLKKNEVGYYIHDALTPLDNLVLSVGYRYDRAEYHYDPGTPDSRTLEENAFTAGINYIYSGKSTLYGGYTRGFRYPVLDELFSFFTNVVDSNLVAQRSDDFELGVRHYFKDDVSVNLTVFRMDVQQEIFFNPLTYGNENLDGMTRRQGIEVSFKASLGSGLLMQGSYTYLQATIEEGELAGKDIPGVAKNKATLSATLFPLKGLSLLVNGTYVSGRPFISDFRNEFPYQENYFVMNSRIEYRQGNCKGFIGVNNLLNKEYAEYGVLGLSPSYEWERGYYPSPSRNYLAGLSWNF
jgi:iron complex outermembrane recepter protein